MKPKTIGIVGGAGPLAGAYLLALLLRFASSNYGCYKDADFPKVILIRKANLYKSAFDCVYPEVKVQAEVDEIIDQILRGKDQLSNLSNLIASLPNTTIILGCTELSLLKSKLSLPNKNIIDPLEPVAIKILEKSFYKNKELK